VLEPGDAIAQLAVATISSTPAVTMKASVTYKQTTVGAKQAEIEIPVEKLKPQNG
jgi:hypothetical protein